MYLLNLYSEVIAHIDWMREFESNIIGNEGGEADSLLDVPKCQLCDWLNDACQQRCGYTEEFRLLKHRHEQLHALAYEIWKLRQRGEDTAVITQLKSLKKLSTDITHILGRLSTRHCSLCRRDAARGVNLGHITCNAVCQH